MGNLFSNFETKEIEKPEIVPQPFYNDMVITQNPAPLVLFYRYIGTGYYGLQLNPELPTIEGVLFEALISSGILPDNATKIPGKLHWSEASRTDAGVHACSQVLTFLSSSVEGKTCGDLPNLINSKMPKDSPITIMGVLNLDRKFNAQKWAEFRRYNYLMPLSIFFKQSKEHLDFIRNEVCQHFIGEKNFHNFTRHVEGKDPSAKRRITDFTFSDPFLVNNEEYVLWKIRGNSFMLNQIRKMLAVVLAASYNLITLDDIDRTLSIENWRLNRLPGEGLMLDKVEYPSTVKSTKKHPIRNPKKDVEFETWRPSIEFWKKTVLFPHIHNTIKKDDVFNKWIKDVLLVYPPMTEIDLNLKNSQK